MNRITRYLEEAPEDPTYGDFYVVAGEFGRFEVTPAVARRIAVTLDRWIRPPWITFHDRAGSRIRVRPRQVRTLIECTAEQRAIERKLERAREEEEKSDRRPWDD